MSPQPSTRHPPSDPQAEAAVLSAMLLDPKACDAVVGILQPGQFFSEANRWICEAAFALLADGKPVDTVTVAGWLRDHGRMSVVGGAVYLAKLIDEVPFVANVEAYAHAVASKANVRRLIATCQKIAAEGYGEPGAAPDFVQQASEAIEQIAREAAGAKPGQDLYSEKEMFAEVAREMIDGKPVKACTTGVADLDIDLGGHMRGAVTWMGADTNWGKSSYAVMTADEVIRGGGKVLLVSCEDRRSLFARRLIARRAKVSAYNLRQHCLSDADFSQVLEVAKAATDHKFFIEAIGMRAENIAARIEHVCKTQPIDLVMVDYLQAIRLAAKAQDKRVETSEVARVLTDAIKRSNAAGLLFTQIRRLPDGQTPTMHDLKESGDIENMAENVLLGYKRKDGASVLRLAKAKDALKCDYVLEWDPKSCCFRGGRRIERDAA